MDLAIFLAPPTLQLAVADTITSANSVKLQLSATSLGFPVVTPHAEWTSSDRTVAVVDSFGTVSATGLGLATITARVNGEKSHTQVSVVRGVVAVNIAPPSVVGAVGDTVSITASAVDAQGVTVGGTAYTFTTGDPTIATVTRTGNQAARVVLLKAGTAFVNVAAGGQVGSAPVTVH